MHLFVIYFSILLCFSIFSILQMLTSVLALHWGFCPFTNDEGPSMLRARCVNKGGGGSEMRISTRVLYVYVSVMKICKYVLCVFRIFLLSLCSLNAMVF